MNGANFGRSVRAQTLRFRPPLAPVFVQSSPPRADRMAKMKEGRAAEPAKLHQGARRPIPPPFRCLFSAAPLTHPARACCIRNKYFRGGKALVRAAAASAEGNETSLYSRQALCRLCAERGFVSDGLRAPPRRAQAPSVPVCVRLSARPSWCRPANLGGCRATAGGCSARSRSPTRRRRPALAQT